MRLFEYQAKKIFKERGIPVPVSKLVRTSAEIPVGGYPAVFKAQVLSGGRGKAGGIKVVENAVDAKPVFDRLMRLKIKNEPTMAVLVEEKTTILKEYYLSLVIDRQKSRLLFVASPQGGMDIETVAHESPDQILREPVDILLGLQNYSVRKVDKFLGIASGQSVKSILQAMFEIFQQEDATLVEINPLVETPAGLMALDAKMILDDKAAFRQKARFAGIKDEQAALETDDLPPDEKMARDWEITYVKLDGNIGIISDGAGTGMLTLDMVTDQGGKAANFCELGGLGDADRMQKGLQMLTANPAVRVALISLIGGLTRMDDMANGIATFLEQSGSSIPIVVRMCGTQEEEGRRILAEKKIFVGDDLGNVVSRAVEIARDTSR